MLKRLAVVLSFGSIMLSAALFAQDENTEKVVQVEKQVEAPVPTSAVNQEIEGIAARLAAREGELAGNRKQGDAVRNLLKLLTAGRELQQRMLDALPAELRVQIEQFFTHHKDFVARVHAPHAISTLGQELQNTLGASSVENEPSSITDLRLHLDAGMLALRSGLWGTIFDTMTKKQRSDVREMLGDMFAGVILGGSNPMAALASGQTADSAAPDEDIDYDIDNLRSFVEVLTAAQKDFKQLYPACAAFDHFKGYVEAVACEDVHAMAQAAFTYLEPLYISVTKELIDIQSKLYELFKNSMSKPVDGAAAVIALPVDSSVTGVDLAASERSMAEMNGLLEQDDAQTLYGSNPYFYWLSALKRQEGGCTAYHFIKKRFKQEGVGKEYFQLFRLFAHAYTLAHHCLDIYHDELSGINAFEREVADAGPREAHELKNKKRAKNKRTPFKSNFVDRFSFFSVERLAPTLLNYALTSTVAANYFFKVQEVARNNMCYDVLMSKGSVTDVRTQVRALVADYMGMAVAAPTLWGSPLMGLRGRQTKLGGEVEKLAASWMYYHLFYNGLFNRNELFKANHQPDEGNWSLWPAEFGVFQNALLSTIDESATLLCRVAEASCYNKLNPDVMEDIDVATLGIVNPGAIRYVVRAFMPMLLLSDMGSILRLPANAIHDHYAQYGLLEAGDAKLHGMSPAAHFAEKTMYRYVCRSIGYNAGEWASSYVHEELFDAAGSALRGLFSLGDKVGIGLGDSQEMLSVFTFAATSAAEMMIDYVKLFLWPSAELEHMIEPILRGYLLDSGYLNVDHDKNAYRLAVVNMVLTQLAIQGLVHHYDVSLYVHEFKRDPSRVTIDKICRKIGSGLKKQLVCMGAGKAAEWLADKAGGLVYRRYGPFTPKVKALVANALA